jgi:hypothetical protein
MERVDMRLLRRETLFSVLALVGLALTAGAAAGATPGGKTCDCFSMRVGTKIMLAPLVPGGSNYGGFIKVFGQSPDEHLFIWWSCLRPDLHTRYPIEFSLPAGLGMRTVMVRGRTTGEIAVTMPLKQWKKKGVIWGFSGRAQPDAGKEERAVATIMNSSARARPVVTVNRVEPWDGTKIAVTLTFSHESDRVALPMRSSGSADTTYIHYLRATPVPHGGPEGNGLVGTLADEGERDLAAGSDDDYPCGSDFRFWLTCAADPVSGLRMPGVYEQRLLMIDSAGRTVTRSILITVPADENPPPDDEE